jgi:hypothetical protein
MQNRAIQVFISYSWSSDENIQKVVDLASRLRDDGIDVKLDKWDLKPGHDKYTFMEQMVTSENIERVLLICDKSYSEKANKRAGGVGDETALITPEIYGKMSQEKFIPLIFEYDKHNKPCCPAYVKSRIYIDFSDSADYEKSYEELLRLLYNKPQYQKPALGQKPEWIENDSPVNLSTLKGLLRKIKNDNVQNPNRSNELASHFMDSFLNTVKQYTIERKDIGNGKIIIDRIDELKQVRDILLDAFIVLLSTNISIIDFSTNFYERFYNEVVPVDGEYENEHFEFFLWECFICTNAILLKREKYIDLREILRHTYFSETKSSENGSFNYPRFQVYPQIIEEILKPACDNPRLFSLASEIISKRIFFHTINFKDIVKIDIVLCQLSFIYFSNDYLGWFPYTYVYFPRNERIWHKLISKKYCEKVLALFDAQNIDEMKKKISECKIPNGYSYSGAYNRVPQISLDIPVEQIGTMY